MPYDAGLLHPPEVQLAAALLASTSALVTGPDRTGAALLRAVAAHLALSRTRVLRIGPPLDLPGFLDQIIKAGGAAGDTGLEQGFAALTDPDPSCDRIALLVEDAHLMADATLRYIEFALHAGPHLCVAFAGQPGIADILGLPGYAGLRKRLSLRLALPPPQPAASMAAPLAAPLAALTAAPTAAPSADAAPVRRRGARMWRELAGAALAAGVAVFVWTHLVPLRGTSVTDAVQVQPADAVPAGPSLVSGVRPTITYAATGEIAGVEAEEPAPSATQRAAAAVPPGADLVDLAPSGTLANLPPAPDLTAAPAVPTEAQAAGPGPAMATTEPPAFIPASRIPDAAPDLLQPVLADAPAAAPPAASSQDGPMLAVAAGLPPEPSAPVPPLQGPAVQAAPQVAGPPMAPGQDGLSEAAIAGLQPEPTVPAAVPPLPAPTAQTAQQVAGPPAAPGQDGSMRAAAAGLPHEPPAPASSPPPAQAVQAAPQVDNPLAAPGHDGPTLAAIAGLPPAPPASTPSQPATDLSAAPQAAGRRTVPAPRYPSTIQTAARALSLRRLPPRTSAIPAEQAAARPVGSDLGYCRGIVLRAQLGEELTYGDRVFMRNGCR